MKNEKLIIFDFDWTLLQTDSYFIKTINWCLEGFGLPEIKKDKITPLLITDYAKLIEWICELEPRLDTKKLSDAIQNRRLDDLKKHGRLYDNTLFTLDTLIEQWYKLSICTNRHTDSVMSCIDNFKLNDYFIEIKWNDQNIEKAILVKETLNKFKPNQAWFVWDGNHDQIAAEKNNIPFIYAVYGFWNNEIHKNTFPIDRIEKVLNILNITSI